MRFINLWYSQGLRRRVALCEKAKPEFKWLASSSTYNPGFWSFHLLLYTEFHFQEVFNSQAIYRYMNNLCDPHFYSCCEVAPNSWAIGFSINSLGLMTSTVPIQLLRNLQWSELSNQKCFSQLKSICSVRNGAPTKAEEQFLQLFVL